MFIAIRLYAKCDGVIDGIFNAEIHKPIKTKDGYFSSLVKINFKKEKRSFAFGEDRMQTILHSIAIVKFNIELHENNGVNFYYLRSYAECDKFSSLNWSSDILWSRSAAEGVEGRNAAYKEMPPVMDDAKNEQEKNT